MLIDDSLMDRALAEEAFASLDQPCTLSTLSSGREALDALLAPGAVLPDVVLLDINMPGMDGFTVLQQLKRHPILKTLPVLMLTTSTNDEDVQRAYTLHASAYLPKPLAFEYFLEQVQSLVQFWRQACMTTWPVDLSPEIAPQP